MAKKISLKGTVIRNNDQWIYDWLEWDSICPRNVEKALQEANGEEVETDINSGGGNAYMGAEIYSLFRDYNGSVYHRILGLAASAASVISMSGRCDISPVGLLMIHCASREASGNHNDMEQAAEHLRTVDQSIVNAYREKTGMSDSELSDLMNQEKWFSAKDALDYKLVDGIMFSEQNNYSFQNAAAGVTQIPQGVMDKVKQFADVPKSQVDWGALRDVKAQYEYLKLKGEIR